MGSTQPELKKDIELWNQGAQMDWTQKLAVYLGVDVKWLTEGIGEPRPKNIAPPLDKADVNASRRMTDTQNQEFAELMRLKGEADEAVSGMVMDILEEHFVTVLYALHFDSNGIGVDFVDREVGYIFGPRKADNCFAAQVVGNGLAPRYENGEFLILGDVETTDPENMTVLKVGDEVLVTVQEGPEHTSGDFAYRLGKLIFVSDEKTCVQFSDGKGGHFEKVYVNDGEDVSWKVLCKHPKSTLLIKQEMIDNDPMGTMLAIRREIGVEDVELV